ncbi:hypothetical protein LZ30DRAFT_177465 [Colletotrichum cereale]|nr:hypothetical protein LZ30DRAFT_177465 [Colletotrichum cereale]
MMQRRHTVPCLRLVVACVIRPVAAHQSYSGLPCCPMFSCARARAPASLGTGGGVMELECGPSRGGRANLGWRGPDATSWPATGNFIGILARLSSTTTAQEVVLFHRRTGSRLGCFSSRVHPGEFFISFQQTPPCRPYRHDRDFHCAPTATQEMKAGEATSLRGRMRGGGRTKTDRRTARPAQKR